MSEQKEVTCLLPCPFCGGEACIQSNRDTHKLYAEHGDDCIWSADDDPIITAPATDNAFEALTVAWNTRAKDTKLAAHQERWVEFEKFDCDELEVANALLDLKERQLAASKAIAVREAIRLGAEYAFKMSGVNDGLTICDEEIDEILSAAPAATGVGE